MHAGIDITEIEKGLLLQLDVRGLHILSQILLRAKFPPDYIYTCNELLSRTLNDLIDAVHERLNALETARAKPFVIPQSDPFAQAAMKAIDDYIAQGRAAPQHRDDLLRRAFKPHKVEGFE